MRREARGHVEKREGTPSAGGVGDAQWSLRGRRLSEWSLSMKAGATQTDSIREFVEIGKHA